MDTGLIHTLAHRSQHFVLGYVRSVPPGRSAMWVTTYGTSSGEGYPLITPNGLSLATGLLMAAAWRTWTTWETSL